MLVTKKHEYSIGLSPIANVKHAKNVIRVIRPTCIYSNYIT